jgi:hypothetical protein
MFSFFKRNPAKDMQRIPVELFSAALAGGSNACNILNGAGLQRKFSREAIFAEVCAFHVITVICTMNRVEAAYGSRHEKFDKRAEFLQETVPGVLNRLKEPKMLNGLKARGFALPDTEYVERHLIAEKTLLLAAAYYLETGLDVDDNDVLEFARKYNTKILSVDSYERSNPIYAHIIRCVRLSHLEDIQHNEFRASFVGRFNDALVEAAIDLERSVERLMPKLQRK